MKYMNIIKLLSVLLCIGMLFVACDNGDTEKNTDEAGTTVEAETEEVTEPATDESLLENVEPKFENFFEILEAESVELGTASRVEGEIIDQDKYNELFVLKKTDIDTKNNVTETFEVYSLQSGKIVLTVNNTYYNGDYATFDWDNFLIKGYNHEIIDGGHVIINGGDVKYPSSVVDVELYNGFMIVVKEAKLTEIEEDVRLDNPDGCLYEIEFKYSYYDIFGTLITESNNKLDIEVSQHVGSDVFTVKLGATVAYFDMETYKLIKTGDRYSQHATEVYQYETDKYGYYIYSTGTIAGLGEIYYLDVVDKTDGKLDRYYADTAYEYPQMYVLHNGDILFQYINEVKEGDPYDFAELDSMSGEFGYYQLAHVLLSVDDGVKTAVDLPYYFNTIIPGEDYAEMMMLEYDNIGVTENARNVAYAEKIVDKKLEDSTLLILDNDMKVLYELEKIVPEHMLDIEYALGFKILDNGDYLVDLVGVSANRAIVRPDGTVRAYLKDTMQVVGDHIIDVRFDETSTAIEPPVIGCVVYDYDLNELYDVMDAGYTYVTDVFGQALFARDEDAAETYKNYYVLEKTDSGKYSMTLKHSDVSIEETGVDYVILKDKEEEKYTLYDKEMEALLKTAGVMNIVEFDGGYIVTTVVAGHYVLYTIG